MKLRVGAALVTTAFALARAEDPSAGDPLPLPSSSPASIVALLNRTVESTVGAATTTLKTVVSPSSDGSGDSTVLAEPTPAPSKSMIGAAKTPQPIEDTSVSPTPITPPMDSSTAGEDHRATPIVLPPSPPGPAPTTRKPDPSRSPSPDSTTTAPPISTTPNPPHADLTAKPTPTQQPTPDIVESPPPPQATMAPVTPPAPTVTDSSASSDEASPTPTRSPTPDEEDEDDYEISPTPPPKYLQPVTPRVEPDQEDRQNSSDAPATTSRPTSVTPSTSETSVMSPSTPLSVDQTTTPPPQRYRRGDEIMTIKHQLSDGTTVDVQVIVKPAHAPMTLVRSANTLSTSGNQMSETGSLVSVLRYIMPAMAFLSLWMLVFFHFTSFVPSRALVSKYLRLNQWELLVFITYIQTLGATALYIVRAAPQSLWDFVDGFSWTVFIPFHKSGSAVSSINSSTRRLSEYVVLDGVVAFSDRIGVNETELLETSVGGFLILSGILVAICLVALLLLKLRRKSLNNDNENSTDTRVVEAWTHIQRAQPSLQQRPMLLVYGLAVFVGTFALYPLTLMVTFEITSESRAGQYATSALTIALFVVLLICLPLILRSIKVIYSIDTAEDFKRRKHTRVVWGVLCSSKCITYEARTFVVALWFVSQVLSAIVVGAVLSEVWQLLLLVAINATVLGSIVVFRPFSDGLRSLPGVVTCLFSVVRILNCALSFGFISTASAPRNALGSAFIFFNSVLIALWFARHCLMIFVVIRAFCSKSDEQQPAGLSPLESAATDAAYASALYVMVPPTQDGHRGGSAML